MILGGRFELGEQIGAGALAVVYAAIDRATDRRVAVKLAAAGVDDTVSLTRRFEREAAALAVIQSAHVVELIAAGVADDARPYLVLERLDGQNLAEVLAARGSLAPSDVVRVVGEAASALELAHGLGIVHRDLKPANLFLHRRDRTSAIVKVLDFGMVIDTGGPTERLRDAFGGTPLYMAPEQVRGQLTRIGPATDIWAMALVALTLLTGEAYWTASTATAVMEEIEAGALEAPSRRWGWLGEPFDAWFARSTARVPERRYRTAIAQATALGAVLRDVRVPDRPRALTAAALITASTMAQRTPTPSIVRVSGRALPVIGRQVECGTIEPELGPGRVVTLTGPAGVGKTRLAQLVCEAAGDRFIDGTWLVELPVTSDEAQALDIVATAIASVLQLAPDTTRTPFDAVADALALRRAMVALDGAEHVVGIAGTIERLRQRAPGMAWLVTSRLSLGVAGEREIAVEPLELPPVHAAIAIDEARTFSAIELFLRRARESAPQFELDGTNVDDIVAICRAVEGFPLGIELAAAQLATASPAQIRAALARGSVHGSAVGHAVAWSYSLLAPDQQRMLRQLAVLPAGLTFEQTKRAFTDLSPDPMYAVLRLVQTHLVMWSTDTPRRLVMLDTVRELALDHAAAHGELPILWRVAAQHAGAVAAAHQAMPSMDAWLALVDAEHENLRATLAYLLDAAPEDAMRLAGQLAYYWYLRGHYDEGARYLEAALARAPARASSVRVRALQGAGRLALLMCQYGKAESLLESARELARGDITADVWVERGRAETEQLLGSIARERGDYARSLYHHDRSLALWSRLGDLREAARSRNYLLFAAWLGDAAGDPRDVQRSWWEKLDRGDGTLEELRALGDPELVVWALMNRGAVLHYRGDSAARESLGQAFAEAVAARFHEGIAWSLDLVGKISLGRGELLQARAQLAASLRVHRRLGDRWRCASVLEALAAVAVAGERPARAAQYLGAADAIRTQIGAPVPACERPLLTATESAGTEQIGSAFAAGRERGRRTPLDQVVELAREIS